MYCQHPLSESLALWYEHNGRDLPWRAAPDAYKVWLSEIILQQTTVKQGTDYYLRFIERFPTVEALAAASEDEVLRLWQGLGYYTRARNLYKASQQVVAQGGFPTDFKGLRALSGVGDYTAAAIASIAFDLPHAVVDGNVYRVLARHFGLDTPIDTTAGKKAFAILADELLDKKHPGRHNQAMMDFGATQCTPHSPHCGVCPLAGSCVALAEGRVDTLPVKARHTKPTEIHIDYVLVHTPTGLYLRQRAKKGIWAGLWEIVATAQRGEELIGSFVHHLTHRTILCRATAMAVEEGTEIPGYTFVRWDDLDRYALPRLIENIIEKWKKKN